MVSCEARARAQAKAKVKAAEKAEAKALAKAALNIPSIPSIQKPPDMPDLPDPKSDNLDSLDIPVTTTQDSDVGSRFMAAFGEMAKTAAQSNNESVIQMSTDGFLLIVSQVNKEEFSCQAMDQSDQGCFMQRLYSSVQFDTPLKPPYTPDEVELFEIDNGIKLPHLLRYYLIHISRESCCDSTRMVIDITSRPSIKIYVEHDADPSSERKAWVSLQYTDQKIVLLDGDDDDGRLVTMDDTAKGSVQPLWLSIFFPNAASAVT